MRRQLLWILILLKLIYYTKYTKFFYHKREQNIFKNTLNVFSCAFVVKKTYNPPKIPKTKLEEL